MFGSTAPSIESTAHALLGALQEGIVVKDRRGRILDVSDRMCEMTGFSRGELVGARAPYPYWPDDQHDTLRATLEGAINAGTTTAEGVFCRKDGTRFHASLDIAPLPGSAGGPASSPSSATSASRSPSASAWRPARPRCARPRSRPGSADGCGSP